MDVLISLDARRARKDGTFPIILRISGNSQTLSVPTGFYAPKSFWNESKREIKKGYSGYGSISYVNNYLNARRNIARSVISKLEEQGALVKLSIKEIKARIVSALYRQEAVKLIEELRNEKVIAHDGKKAEMMSYLDALVESGELAGISKSEWKPLFVSRLKTGSVFAFLKEIHSDLLEMNKVGNANVYKCLEGALRNFWGGEDLNFNQIDLQFLQDMEKWHLKKGRKINGLGTYLRTLSATYNRAVRAGLADRMSNPFLDYTIRRETTAKRAISKEKLIKIFELEFPQDSHLFHARNYFMVSFLCQGMSFIDMAFLKKSDIIDGRVKYRRTKTSRLYNLKVSPMLQEIFDYYSSKDKLSKVFIFPIIKRESVSDQYKDAKWARKRFNRQLKEIAEMCGIEETLTSYVARHSFAMSARLANTPIEVISQMLGHSDTKTTQIYLDSIPDNVVDGYVDKVFAFTQK